MRHCPPSPRLHPVLVTLVTLVALAASPGWAGVPPPPATDLEARAFARPDLAIGFTNVPLEEVRGALPNAAVWDAFFARHGTGFEVFIDPRSGAASNVVGPVPLIPGPGLGNEVTLEAMSARLGRRVERIDEQVVGEAVVRFIAEHREALGISPAQLGPARATQVSDQLWQVHLPQQVGGVPVRYGRFVATISHGNLVLLGAELWGEVAVSTRPALDAARALAIGFDFVGGRSPGDLLLAGPALAILPVAPPEHQVGDAYAGPIGEGYRHLLVWAFTFERRGEAPRWEVLIDAVSGEVVSLQDTNQYLDRDFKGGVYPQTSTEICPTGAFNLFDHTRCGVLQSSTSTNPVYRAYPMCWADTGLVSPAFTDGAGMYNWPLNATVTTTLSGSHININDGCGMTSQSSTTGFIDLLGTNGHHDCTVPAGASAGNTSAARTTFYDAGKIAEIGRGWLPGNLWLQGTVPANTNVAGTCNGFWNGSAINFFRSAAGCRNAGENLTFINHEWGHGLDDNDANGVLSNSSEGYADIAAIYRTENSCVFYGFFTPAWVPNSGCGLTVDGTGQNRNESQTGGPGAHCIVDCSGDREADWAQHADGLPDTPLSFVCPHCGGGGGPCGRQVHCAASPIRQAAWDLAARDLKAAPFHLDTNNAFVVASKLFYQGSGNIGLWYACSCTLGTSDGCGAASGYMQWLAADDDNGNVNDGTPHMTAIHAAFNRHAIACNAPAPFNTGCSGAPVGRPKVSMAVDATSVGLRWTSVAGASSYWVLRSEGLNGCSSGKALIATVNGTSYTDTEVLPGFQYCYTIVPVGSSGACFGRASLCACTTPLACKVTPPSRLLGADFSSGIPAGWTVINGGSGGGASATWNINNPCGLSIAAPFSGPFAEVNSQCAGLGATQDEQLVTPRVGIDICDQVSLQFDSQLAWSSAGGNEIADVDVSVDGGTTWFNVLRMENASNGFPNPPGTEVLDLTPRTRNGTKLDVRFHYWGGSGDGWWAIDNVMILCQCPKLDSDSFPVP